MLQAALAAPALAQALPGGAVPQVGMYSLQGQPVTLLTVVGNAEVEAVPDTAQVTLGINVLAPTAQEAQAQATAVINRIVSALQALGVQPAQIRTAAVRLNPEYQPPRPEEAAAPPRLVGFRAVSTLTVTTSDFALLGRIIDQAVQAGANEVQGITFLLRNPEAAMTQALLAALADALQKGRALALRLGQRVEAVRSVRTGAPPAVVPLPVAFAARATALPIFPGTQPVQAEVTVELLTR